MAKEIDGAEVLKRYKEAKTALEMFASWRAKTGATKEEAIQGVKEAGPLFEVWSRAPLMENMVKLYMQEPMIQEMERGILDRKVKEFIMIAVCADMGSAGGVSFHMAAAMAQGATEEELMEVLFLTGYEQAKNKLLAIGPSIADGFTMGAEAQKRLGIK